MGVTSKITALVILLGMMLFVGACQQIRETQYLMEVTVEVTRVVVVTATPDDESTVVAQAEATPLPPPPPTQTPVPTSSPVPQATAIQTQPDNFPAPVMEPIIVAEQLFERGRMYYIQPLEQIWVLINDDTDGRSGLWAVYDDTWRDGLPESDPSIEVPEGFVQPIRGFGKLWRENDLVRNELGWGLGDEYGFWVDYIYEYGGTLDEDGEYIAGPGLHRFSGRDGTFIQFDELDGTWSLIERTSDANTDE